MRYLLQQMIAFFAIILTVLLIFGMFFTQFTKTTVKQTSYDQLRAYANTITDNMREQGWTLKESLDTTSAVAKNQNVYFYYLSTDRTATYPKNIEGSNASNIISDSELKDLEKGEYIQKTVIDSIGDKKTTMAMHVQPLFDASNWNFEGILIVWQPNSNIEESVGLLTQNLFKGFIISTVIALIISYILAKFQVNRINRMRKATKQIADGNFDVHLDVKNNDELDDLAEDFNQMAVALKDSHIEIDRQEERRRNFMADVAHEMRTPLTTINGLLEGLAFNAIPENQKDRCISLMQNETRRLIRLVNENLDYEKILTNQITIAIQKLNGTEILENVIEQLDKKAQEKNDQLILETIEPVDVYADYDRFVQVMVNVITNAIQFTEDGQIRIGITRGYMETIVTISDTGIGMSEEQVKNIWDRYYKADPSRKNTKYGESGLGLSIVDQLVKLHGGTIKVESKLDEGTTFTITFPDQQPN
ncbi:sensor histidine kinase [Vagococcus fluvialis]|uniref:histidine kinase n=1 Tax=Vagococcus fluvialis TaxID=2738 RepID=A0A369AVA0_9ENTE|nr:HAMP domain-containing sensor histidine kinase [Vagococcus fluvialis]MBO0479187.1 HAMP domain-containing histidine kinase [Vagococcus fluvialis]MBO0485578.1 HAMP domain-containing histidine kinase [Vagococcus fluvialis]MCM2137924.1 HAMP domain-containing histidine kinase [Vagococcus fluvialis]MDT2745511.1 HAMP domain-containing sensor histidine kinase [Vagococcus fluvialis]RCX13131.1 signal transduction histidine kinase [Vagococcus fluvialis]